MSRLLPSAVALLFLAVPTLAHDMNDPDAEWYQSLPRSRRARKRNGRFELL
jgi:hypothetical protein